MRGFLSGAIAGGVASVIGAAALSLFIPLAPRPEVESVSPETADTKVDLTTNVDVVINETSDADVVEAAPNAPEQESLEGKTTAPITEANMSSADQPDVAESTPEMSEPAQVGDTPQISVDADTPVVVPSKVPSPETPEIAEEKTVDSLAPERPEIQDHSDAETRFGQDEEGEGTAPEITTQTDPARDNALAVTPEVSVPVAETPPVAETASAEEPVMKPAEPETGRDDMTAPADAQTGQQGAGDPEESAEPEPVVVAIVTPEAEETPQPEQQNEPPKISTEETDPTLAEDAQAGLSPRIGKRVVPLTDRDKTSQIAGNSVTSDEAAANGDAMGAPLARYAVPFENPENRPLMSILLIDDHDSIGVEALRDFPYPLTFAIDPNAPDAAAKMARHRESGFEVVALIDLPENATPSDVEVALAASFQALPESIGLLEGTETGIQGNRDVSNQVSAFAGSTGRGLITQGNGLNTVQKLAVRNGVPAAAIFRDFDGAEQSPSVMRRFLDQAAFRAGQEGAVIMMGRVRPDTVSALLLWGLQDRAARVALAPVSAVLEKTVSGN